MPLTDCPGCLRLETLVLDVARRLVALERRLAARGRQDDAAASVGGRALLVTPFVGAYGFAGVVVALNGSPPRGIVLVPKGAQAWMGGTMAYLSPSGRVRTLSDGRHRRACRAVRAYLQALGYDESGLPRTAGPAPDA